MVLETHNGCDLEEASVAQGAKADRTWSTIVVIAVAETFSSIKTPRSMIEIGDLMGLRYCQCLSNAAEN